MMKKQNSFRLRWMQATVVASLILPQMLMAEYGSSVSDIQADTNSVTSALNRTTPRTANGEVDFQRLAQQRREAAQRAIGQTQEEIDRINKIGKWRDKIDSLNALSQGLQTTEQNNLKKRSANLNNLSRLSGALADSTSFVDTNAVSNNGLTDACKRGVDFSQAQSLFEQPNSKDAQDFAKEILKFRDEKKKDVKDALLKNLTESLKKFEANADLNAELDSKSSPDLFAKDNSPDSRKKKQEDALKALKEAHKDKTKSVLGEVLKFAKSTLDTKDNDDKLREGTFAFAKSVEASLSNAKTSVVQSLDKLFKNCQKEQRALVSDINTSALHIERNLVQQGVEATLARNTAQLDAQAQLQRANQLRCGDTVAQADQLLQATNLKNILSTMKTRKNATEAITDAVNAMNEVKRIQSEVGRVIQPLKDDCEDMSNSREAVKQRIAQIAPQGTSGGSSGVASSNRGSSNNQFASTGRNGSPVNRATHNR